MAISKNIFRNRLDNLIYISYTVKYKKETQQSLSKEEKYYEWSAYFG